MVEHHYFDAVVEGDGGVWLSPWGEGRFCLMGLPAEIVKRFESDKPLFVRAYGHPVVTEHGLCLRDVFVVAGDRPWTTMVLEYGPGGSEDFSEADAASPAARPPSGACRGGGRWCRNLRFRRSNQFPRTPLSSKPKKLAWRNWQTRVVQVHVPVRVSRFKSGGEHRKEVSSARARARQNCLGCPLTRLDRAARGRARV